MRSFLMLVALLLVPCVGSGATVVSDSKIAFGPELEPFAFGNYSAKVDQDLLGDYTETWFEFKKVSASEFSMEVVSWNLDEEADWYLVESGDYFSKETVGGFTPLFTTDVQFPAVSVGSDFYLGVNTGNFAGDAPGQLVFRDVFGWVHFQVVNDGLVMVGNVMSYGGGLVVGVPEPSCVVLGCFGVLAFWRRVG